VDTLWGVDVWTCPECKPLKKPLDCYHLAIKDGEIIEVHCTDMKCRTAGARHNNLTDHLKHMEKVHKWEVPKPKKGASK
jgi:hypothetical protein